MSIPTQQRRVLLVTTDLLASSRLAGQSSGLVIEIAGSPAAAAAGPYDIVLLDVQACPDTAAAVAAARAAVRSAGIVIAFGPHVWKERLAAAVAAGADAAASRGEVLEGLAALLARVAPPPADRKD
ncbi:MAG: hypothetical protein ACKO4T_02885 [Planctomycetaceae bacterium]